MQREARSVIALKRSSPPHSLGVRVVIIPPRPDHRCLTRSPLVRCTTSGGRRGEVVSRLHHERGLRARGGGPFYGSRLTRSQSSKSVPVGDALCLGAANCYA